MHLYSPMMIYSLCYPDGTPFYFGCSLRVRERFQTHLRQARDLTFCTDKDLTIREIWQDKNDIVLRPLFYVRGSFDGEFAEQGMIWEYPGKLANMQHCPPYKRQRPNIPVDWRNHLKEPNNPIWQKSNFAKDRAATWIMSERQETLRVIEFLRDNSTAWHATRRLRFAHAKLTLLQRDFDLYAK